MLENQFQEKFKNNFSSCSKLSGKNRELQFRASPINIMNARSETNIITKTQILPKSWTDKSFYLNQDDINIYVLKYSQLSRSERYLDLLECSNKTKVISEGK
jgi:hypothetical protein